MHCELVVPGLFQGEDAPRLAALELLLARGRRRTRPPQELESWTQEAFELGDGPFPAGELTMVGAEGWVRADPVHLRVLRDRVVVVPAEALQVTWEEARSLCDALNEQFPEANFTAVQPRRWCARMRDIVEERPALHLAGREPEISRHATPLLTEIQMVLHAHPLNEAREARGEPPLNSLWCWGAGRAAAASARWQSTSTDDPAIAGAARLAGTRSRPLPRSAAEWLERLPGEGRHLAVLDGLRAALALGEDTGPLIQTLERDWFAPLLAALRASEVGMITLHVPDGRAGVSFETIRGDLRRFWRLPKSIERYA